MATKDNITQEKIGNSYVTKRKCPECGTLVGVEMDNNRVPGVVCGCGTMMDVVTDD